MPNPVNIFRPIDLSTVSIAVTVTTGNVALKQSASAYLVTNEGPATVFVKFGDSSVAATVGSGSTGGAVPVPSGAVMVFRPPITAPTHVAAITAASTATVYITAGEGL